jgi:hypothetical protein
MTESPPPLDTTSESIARVTKAVSVTMGDTMSRIGADKRVIWTATGSWSEPAPVTIGDIKALLGEVKRLQHAVDNPISTNPALALAADLSTIRNLVARLNVKHSYLAPSDIKLAQQILSSVIPLDESPPFEDVRFKADICAAFIMTDETLSFDDATNAVMRFFNSAMRNKDSEPVPSAE